MPSTQGLPLRSPAFLLGYSTAQAGAFIGFIPLLTLLLPMKADDIAGADKALLLSQVAMVGGLAAALANVVFGAASDHATGRSGRRRPWILWGLPGVALTLGLIAVSASPMQLIVAFVLFQLAMNAVYAPLTAVVPDMVPDRQKGTISALASAALPVASIFTALVVVGLSGSIAAQFIAVVSAATLLIVPFALRLREPKEVSKPIAKHRFSIAAFRDANFTLAFVSRMLAESGVAIHTLFLLFLLQSLPERALPEGWSTLEVFSSLLLVSTGAATLGGFMAGPLSDRVGRRGPFVIMGALGMAAALALLAGWHAWPGPLVAQLLFGLSHGIHAATVAAMNAEILPDRARAGRDLGVMNLAVALPQSLAPALVAVVLTVGLSLPAVFVVASVMAVIAALALAPLARRI